MPTDGKSLEQLVELLEKMDMEGAEIKIRDKIYDKVAKENREIDVSVRFRKGSHDFLIIFECRDRSRKNGPDWIEQIVQKTRDLGANKVVAVSASGFTKGAIEKAKHHGIILRTIKEISSEKIFDWFVPKSFSMRTNTHVIHRINLCGKSSDFEINKKIDEFIQKHQEKINRTFPFIRQAGVQKLHSPDQIVLGLNSDQLYSDVTCGGQSVKKKIFVYPEDKASGFQLVIDDDILTVDHLEFYVELSAIEKEYDLCSASEYKTDDKQLAQILKFGGVELPEGKKNLEVVLKPGDKGQQLSFRFQIPECK